MNEWDFPRLPPRPNGGGAARATTGSHQCNQRGGPRAMEPWGELGVQGEYNLSID